MNMIQHSQRRAIRQYKGHGDQREHEKRAIEDKPNRTAYDFQDGIVLLRVKRGHFHNLRYGYGNYGAYPALAKFSAFLQSSCSSSLIAATKVPGTLRPLA